MRLLPGAAYRDQTIEPCQKTKTKGQLRGDDFMDELDRRIQALTPEDMLDTSEEDDQNAENFRFADALAKDEAKERPQTD